MEKKAFLTLEQAKSIAEKWPTPWHIYDEQGIRDNAEKVRRAFSWNKGFREYFAVKATPNPFILKILKEYGCGTDCSSDTELMMSEACGFSGHEIMFSSNDTPPQEFALADRLGAIINLDDITHIACVEEVLGKLPETMSCRYNPGGLFELSNGIMDNPGDSKYGMTPEQITEAYRIMMAKGVKHFGIHAFLASNTLSNAYYPKLAGILFQLAADLEQETGCHVTFINLSGGIGIPYKPEDRENDIALIGEQVRQVYDEILGTAGMNDVSLYTELGRYMLGPNGCLVTKVRHLKHSYREYAGVDACSCDLMRPAMYGAYHHITVMGKENLPLDHVYDVTGSLCENNDKLAVQRSLPLLAEGDILVIHDTGAHGHSMGFNYNGKLRSAELLLCSDGGVKLIRRAETPEDYFRTMIF